MSDNLTGFLIDVASDPERAARLAANPAADLDLTTLTLEERTAVLSRTGDVIRDQLDVVAAGGRTSTHHGGKGKRKNGGRQNTKKKRKTRKKPAKKR